MATPYMNLILPVVGPLGTQGPDWANEINAALTLIDQHDHSSGLGKQITPAGLNINQTFQMNSNQISEIASLALDNLVAQPSSSNLIYEYAGELYFNDANANQVQLTSGGTINVASVGTISGDYGGSNPANVSFSNSTETYLFTKAPGETGSIACGPISIYQNVAGSYYAKIQQNVAQAANVDWTLPVALPATKLPMKSSASGVLELSQILTSEIADAQITEGKLTASVAGNGLSGGAGSPLAVNVDNATIEINSDTLRLKDAGITPVKLAAFKYGSQNLTGSTTGSGWTNVGSSVSLTGLTTGRPLFICIQPATADSYIRGLKATGGVGNTTIGGLVRVLDQFSGVLIRQDFTYYLSDDTFTTTWGFSAPGFTRVFVNTSYTSITLQVSISSVNSTTFSLNNMQLFVYEG